jgi:urease accessory protein
MLRIQSILGLADDERFSELLHALTHDGAVEAICLTPQDMLRHHLRVRTDYGTECAISLPRGEHLCHGALLWLEPGRAIVVKSGESVWLTFRPFSTAAALELGYLAGNMHWKVRIEEGLLKVAAESGAEDILRRVEILLDSGKVERVTHG